jgi:general secretion pathway protein G
MDCVVIGAAHVRSYRPFMEVCVQKRTLRRRNRRLGMTLIEIMIVVVIIGMLTAAAGLGVMNAKKTTDAQMARTDIRTLASVAEAYQMLNGVCPTMTQLRASDLLKRGSNTRDPWGTDYVIRCDEMSDVDVLSWGPDRAENTADDVTMQPMVATP